MSIVYFTIIEVTEQKAEYISGFSHIARGYIYGKTDLTAAFPAAGLAHIRIHDHRYSHISVLVNEGINI